MFIWPVCVYVSWSKNKNQGKEGYHPLTLMKVPDRKTLVKHNNPNTISSGCLWMFFYNDCHEGYDRTDPATSWIQAIFHLHDSSYIFGFGMNLEETVMNRCVDSMKTILIRHVWGFSPHLTRHSEETVRPCRRQ